MMRLAAKKRSLFRGGRENRFVTAATASLVDLGCADNYDFSLDWVHDENWSLAVMERWSAAVFK